MGWRPRGQLRPNPVLTPTCQPQTPLVSDHPAADGTRHPSCTDSEAAACGLASTCMQKVTWFKGKLWQAGAADVCFSCNGTRFHIKADLPIQECAGVGLEASTLFAHIWNSQHNTRSLDMAGCRTQLTAQHSSAPCPAQRSLQLSSA